MCLHNNANSEPILHALGINFTEREEDLERGVSETLKYCILSYWIWCPDFSFFCGLSSVSASWEIQSSGASKNQTKNLWLKKREEKKKRDCYGFYFRINFTQVRHKKLHNPEAIILIEKWGSVEEKKVFMHSNKRGFNIS